MFNNDDRPTVLILGAASWLGYLLITQLQVLRRYRLVGSLHQQILSIGDGIHLFQANHVHQYLEALDSYEPKIVVNFLRGEDENGLYLHNEVIKYCKNKSTHYIYASSALALDAYHNIDLTENLLAKSQSAYGSFKAKCEELLYPSPINWTILRFASVQGWVPHKATRNEKFLSKLCQGEKVRVDRGVFQNRMFANVLIKGVLEVIQENITGVLHFGTTDFSEEFSFLKRLAIAFGYADKMVMEGMIERNVNLVTIPSRIFKELEGDYRRTEKDTLKSIAQIPHFQKYKK